MAERWVGDWRERATPEQVEMIKRICLDSYASALNFTPNARQIPDIATGFLQQLTPEQLDAVKSRCVEMLDAANSLAPKATQCPDIRAELLRSHRVPETAGGRMTTTESGELMAAQVAAALRTADLWWCSSDVRDLVSVASASMPDQPLEVKDPPSDIGLIILQSPFIDPDGELPELECATNAFLWFKGYQKPKEGTTTPRAVLQIVSLAWTGSGHGGWIAIGVESWPVGDTQSDGADGSDRADRARIATIWTLARQERVVPQCVVTPSRPVARRVKSAGLPPEAGSVRTLDVRRPTSGTSTGDGNRDYSHRWIVNGHWRNQWLPSRKTHRVQWIAPYVKGPEDKPLVVREDVRVVR